MIRWLRYKVVRVWLWRHVCAPLAYNLFTGRGVYWCGHCGGTIYSVERGQRRVVLRSTCPAGHAVQRYQAATAEKPQKDVSKCAPKD